MNSISFDNVYLLLIAIPLIILFTIPFAIAIRKANRNGHNIASYVLHVVMAIIIAFSAAGTSITSTLTETEVYVVADVSYSANKNLDTIDSYIKNLILPKNAKMGLVCFGKDCELLYDLDNPKKIGSVKNSTVDDSETNIAEALQYTGTLFRDDVIKRIVLITDGKQTDVNDTYAIKRTVDSLEAQSIRVDAIYVDNNLKDNNKEVQISKVDYSRSTYRGREETANIFVETNYDTDAFVTLYKKIGFDEMEKVDGSEKHVVLTVGLNNISLGLDTSEVDTFDYEVRIEAEGDECEYNNSYLFTQTISDNSNVLVITDTWDDCKAAADRYGDFVTHLDIYENSKDSLTKREYLANCPDNINIYTSRNVPFMVEELCYYDEIIVINQDITALEHATAFMESLDKYVALFGKSFVTLGDVVMKTQDTKEDKDKLYTADELASIRKQLVDMLPVRYGSNVDQPSLYFILVDTSYSMQEGDNFGKAKNIAKQQIEKLNPDDYVCLMEFYSDVRIIQNLAPATNSYSIKEEINKLSPKHGSSSAMGNALLTAYNIVTSDPNSYNTYKTLFSSIKVLLISDGNISDANASLIAAKNAYDDYGIVTSAYYVGSGSNSYMNNITVAGGGDQNLGNWAGAELIVDGRETSVKVNSSKDDVLADINVGSIPNVSGYFVSNSKFSATTVLQLRHRRNGNDNNTSTIPLYAYWNYGNGKVSTFTSSFTGSWIESWEENGVGSMFFKNIVSSNLPDEKLNEPYILDISVDGKYANIILTPAERHFGTTANIVITSPNNVISRRVMAFNSSYFYYEFDVVDAGRYNIEISYTYNNRTYNHTETLCVPYKSEYDAFNTFSPSILKNALDGRGTVSMDGKLDLSNDDVEVTTYIVKLTPLLLIICVVLFVVDIAIRKLKWEDIKSFFGLDKNSKTKKQENKQQET